jgi:thiol-disulfide isomerase/thioredoxin
VPPSIPAASLNRRRRSAPFAPRRAARAACLWLLAALLPAATAAGFDIDDDEGNTAGVQVLGAGGSPVILWPNTLSDGPPGVERTRRRLVEAGLELWLMDPLEARFLPPSNEHIRTLSGALVAALIAAAEARAGERPVLLLAHGRMALPVLRGLRRWQQTRAAAPPSTIAGAVLLYPNLFGPTPAAGDEPELDPIVAATTAPLLIVQPELGALRWALRPVLETLWTSGAAAHALLVPGVRDWFLFHEPGADPAEDAAAARLPAQLRLAAGLLAAAPRPDAAAETDRSGPPPPPPRARVDGLRERPGHPTAPAFALTDARGRPHALADTEGIVTLVNFWASWCPPCVEEIPSMNRLAAHYDPTDFQIVSINFRESAATIQAFMARVDVDFPVLIDADGEVARAWRVFAFPSSFLVDRAGRVRWSVNSAIPWDEPAVLALIDALVAEAAPAAADSVPTDPDRHR